MPRSAPINAASNSSMLPEVSFGERVTMRLISCVSFACVFCRPALNLSNNPMKLIPSAGGGTNPGRLRPPDRSALLDFFNVLIGKLDRTDQRLALVHPMAVGTAGDEQMMLIRHLQV